MHFPSHIRLREETRSDLIGLINELLASSIDLYTQVKQAHWNVRGAHFLSRHELFDRVAKHLLEHADELAERLGALGGYAKGTARLVVENSKISEYDLQAVRGDEHLNALVSRCGEYCAELRAAVRRCAELDDPVTEDLLIQMLGESEQDLWFLESHLFGGSEELEERPREIRESTREEGGDRTVEAERESQEAAPDDIPFAEAEDVNREGGEETASHVSSAPSSQGTPWSEPRMPPH